MNIKRIFSYLALLLILLPQVCSAQKHICKYCDTGISSKFIEVEGDYYHPEHFLCAECKKQIEGSYSKNADNFYHPSCYKKIFHSKCDVCSATLEGEYFVDLYGNKYHPEHLQENSRCDNCDRIICENITGGGKQLNDGRNLCNLCLENSVKSNSSYKFLLNKLIDRLRGLGLNIDTKNLSIIPVDRTGLKSAAGAMYSDNLKGFCKISSESGSVNGRKFTEENTTIYVLDNFPPIYTEATLAHELMHVWLHQNTKNNQTDQLKEGSCHYISYLYLKSVNDKTAHLISKMMLSDTNPVYGGGLRKVIEKFSGKYLVELLNYLKKNTSL